MIGIVRLQDGHVAWPAGVEGPRRATDAAPWWVKRGIKEILVLDEDAMGGGGDQWHLLPAFVRHGLRVRFGGGIRSMTQVQQLLDMGCQEVLVDTQALRHPDWLRELLILFPDRVRVHVRLENGRPATGPGEETPDGSLQQLLGGVREAGATMLLITGDGAGPWLQAAEGFDVLGTDPEEPLVEADEAPEPE